MLWSATDIRKQWHVCHYKDQQFHQHCFSSKATYQHMLQLALHHRICYDTIPNFMTELNFFLYHGIMYLPYKVPWFHICHRRNSCHLCVQYWQSNCNMTHAHYVLKSILAVELTNWNFLCWIQTTGPSFCCVLKKLTVPNTSQSNLWQTAAMNTIMIFLNVTHPTERVSVACSNLDDT